MTQLETETDLFSQAVSDEMILLRRQTQWQCRLDTSLKGLNVSSVQSS